MARAHAAAISNGLLQRVPQLVQQPEQLGVFLFRQQIGHIVVRLVEGEDGVFMEADALFRQHQLFQPDIQRQSVPQDARLKRLILTEEGGRVHEKTMLSLHQTDEFVAGLLTEEENAELLRLLNKLRKGLE